MELLGRHIVGALAAALVCGGGLLFWPWARPRGRFAITGAAAFIAWLGWRIVLQLSDGANFDVDNPALLGLSAEDVGSGVLTFLLTAVALGLARERAERAERVVSAAGLAGLLATVLDRFI